MSQPAYTRLDVDERRRQLLDLGAELFARHGYDELSMAKIAREAGISKALLYHYFPSKQAYFAATLEQAAAELAETTQPDPDLPPVEQLAASLDAYLSWIERNADAYAKLIQSVGAVPEVRELVERVRSETADRILAGHRARRPAAPGAARRRPRLAVVHGRRGARLARAPRHGPRAAARPAARDAARRGDRGRRAVQRADAQHDDRAVVALESWLERRHRLVERGRHRLGRRRRPPPRAPRCSRSSPNRSPDGSRASVTPSV